MFSSASFLSLFTCRLSSSLCDHRRMLVVSHECVLVVVGDAWKLGLRSSPEVPYPPGFECFHSRRLNVREHVPCMVSESSTESICCPRTSVARVICVRIAALWRRRLFRPLNSLLESGGKAKKYGRRPMLVRRVDSVRSSKN
jgi:hypothetical protein